MTKLLPLIAVSLSCLSSGPAIANESCQVLADKLTSEFAAARKMSAADKHAKCHAYSMVTLHLDTVARSCANPGDMSIVSSRIEPLAKSLGEDEEKFCSR
jgi:hypothetical protein